MQRNMSLPPMEHLVLKRVCLFLKKFGQLLQRFTAGNSNSYLGRLIGTLRDCSFANFQISALKSREHNRFWNCKNK